MWALSSDLDPFWFSLERMGTEHWLELRAEALRLLGQLMTPLKFRVFNILVDDTLYEHL